MGKRSGIGEEGLPSLHPRDCTFMERANDHLSSEWIFFRGKTSRSSSFYKTRRKIHRVRMTVLGDVRSKRGSGPSSVIKKLGRGVEQRKYPYYVESTHGCRDNPDR